MKAEIRLEPRPDGNSYRWDYYDGPDGHIHHFGFADSFEQAVTDLCTFREHFWNHYVP